MWIEHRIDSLPATTLNEIARLLKLGTRDDYLSKLGKFPPTPTTRGNRTQRIYLSNDSSGKLATDAFLIVWHPQGKTVGTWVAIHRNNDTQELQLWPQDRPITRDNYRLTKSEKRKVDRQGRIDKATYMKNFVDHNAMLPFPELQLLPTVITTNNTLLDPEIVGYPIVSEENYIINYNTIMSRSFLNRS
tara:strand:- start:5411 stop:5977 length:567 start_codon:yes stop_codon:yes gene_type:complete